MRRDNVRKRTRRRQFTSAIAVIATAVMLLPVAAFATKGDGPQGPDPKVAICHFAGHEGDWVITGKGLKCLDLGGNIISISENALGGHGLGD